MNRMAIIGVVAAFFVSVMALLAAEPTDGKKGGTAAKSGPTTTSDQTETSINAGRGPLTPLQQRFLDLAVKKARIMTEEQLQQAVSQTDREVEGLTAWSRLEEAARIIREVTEKHPQTKAAEVGKSALDIIERNRPHGPPSADPIGRRPTFGEEKHYERDQAQPFDRRS